MHFLEDHWTGWIIETIYKDLWRCWVVKKINYVEFSLLWRLCPSSALFKGKKKRCLGKKEKKLHTNRRDYRSIKGWDVANRINGVPRPTLLGASMPICALIDGAVARASVKTCACTASSLLWTVTYSRYENGDILLCIGQSELKHEPTEMTALIRLQEAQPMIMIGSISRRSIDYATAARCISLQCWRHSARKPTYCVLQAQTHIPVHTIGLLPTFINRILISPSREIIPAGHHLLLPPEQEAGCKIYRFNNLVLVLFTVWMAAQAFTSTTTVRISSFMCFLLKALIHIPRGLLLPSSAVTYSLTYEIEVLTEKWVALSFLFLDILIPLE